MSVGNLVIDAGHQNLIGLVNSLEYAIRQKDAGQLQRFFGQFCASARLHFKDEERIMQAIGFPFVPHKLEHQHLLGEIQNTLDELVSRNGIWVEYVMDHYPDLLREWFVKHIDHGIETLKPVLDGHPYNFMPAER